MHEEPITVRPARTADATLIRDMNERAIRSSASDLYTPQQIDAWASPLSSEAAAAMIEHTVTFVAVAGHRVVGFVNLVVDTGVVDQLYVDPSVGGRGVARRLHDVVEQEASSRGLRRLATTASLRAVPVFSSFGYRVLRREERRFNGESFPVAQMAKALV